MMNFRPVIILSFIFLSLQVFSQDEVKANKWSSRSLNYNWHYFQKYDVYITPSETFSIKRRKKTLWSGLKYIAGGHVNPYLQIIDSTNTMRFLNQKMKEVAIPKFNTGNPYQHNYFLPDKNSNNYSTTEIIERNNYYVIIGHHEKSVPDGMNDNRSLNEYSKVLDSIPFNAVKKIYLRNGFKKMVGTQSFVITENQSGFQVRYFTGNYIPPNKDDYIHHYDEINLMINHQATFGIHPVKVRNGKLWGYLQMTEVKYTELNSFIYRLARFKDEKGRTGFIDISGKEYFD